MQPPNTPNILYKYRYFDPKGHHLALIERGEVWFASADSFNDPFDSKLNYTFIDQPPGIRRKWAVNFLKREYGHLSSKTRRQIAHDRLRQIDQDPRYYENYIQDQMQSNNTKFGICSLSTLRDNLLMWAHYSDCHKGFCVGLHSEAIRDVQLQLGANDHMLMLERVYYHAHIPVINFFSSMLSKTKDIDIIRFLCTKSDHWSYEDEYRLISWNGSNKSICLQGDMIAEVIIGCRAHEHNTELLLKAVNQTDRSIPVFQARQKADRFALEFVRIQ